MTSIYPPDCASLLGPQIQGPARVHGASVLSMLSLLLALTLAQDIRELDLASESKRQVIVDREPGQYLGHPTTLLLADGKTMLCAYPKGHGRGAIVIKRSPDAGLTWSERLPLPKSFETSLETPTLHRMVDPAGKERLVLFSGLYPCRRAISENDGKSWGELEAIGEFGGIVVMSSVVRLRAGEYAALYHDDGRFMHDGGKSTGTFTLLQTRSKALSRNNKSIAPAPAAAGCVAPPWKPCRLPASARLASDDGCSPKWTCYSVTEPKDGGLTWSAPSTIWSGSDVHLCEPGALRSPDGKLLAVLLRENRRVKNSHVIFSSDETKTWTAPREMSWTLTGDRHVAAYAPDGRLVVSFRDMAKDSRTRGDWIAWVGDFDDIVNNREGQYRVRLMDNLEGTDCGYPGLESLTDGTLVATSYGHWTAAAEPYIVSVRFSLAELDRMARGAGK